MSTPRRFVKMRDYPARVANAAAMNAYRRWLAAEPYEHRRVHDKGWPCGKCLAYWLRAEGATR